MAEDTIKVSCPGCGATFELPTEMGGETGECTECGAIFEIPRIEAIEKGELASSTDTGAIKAAKAPEGATNTVKLSRASIGMVPDVKDSFAFNVVNTSTHIGMTATSTTKRSKKSITSTSTGARGGGIPNTIPPKKKPWWTKLMFWK